jgi:hypothetical protein
MNVTTRRRPSAAGRRVALERKWCCNVEHYGGRVKLLTLTAPGVDLLPWDTDLCTHPVGEKCSGEKGCKVEWIYRELWNATAQARASRLFEAAQRAADRWVRRSFPEARLPRQLGNVRSEQLRGVWHFHYVFPYETHVERVWSMTVHRYIDRAWRRDLERWPDERERRLLIEREYAGKVTRGFYGLGYANGGKQQGRSAERAAKYCARNAAGYMASNLAGVGRHYVSSRLTRETGITMRALRACNWLYVRQRLIAAGELEDALVPSYWPAEWAAEVLRVYAVVTSAAGP